jgi:hypothetical protein
LFACDPSYFIEIYVDNAALGLLWEPYEQDAPPDCIGSNTTLFLERKIGTYGYIAKSSCGDIEWRGDFKLSPDSCTLIFLDVQGKF